MRGRPSLPLGSHGAVWTRKTGKTHTAFCYYRDMDGATRRVKASAASAQKARNLLEERLANRSVGKQGITADMTIKQLSEAWLESLEVTTDKVKGISQKTKDKYSQAVRHDIVPGLGQVRLHEASVGRLDAFLQGLKDRPSVAFTCRVVLSAMFGLAVRHDAVPVNPVRETKAIVQDRKVKAMSLEDAERLREHIRVWSAALPSRAYFADMTDLFIATGLRPGEMLGLLWTDLDFKNRTLTVTGTLKRDSVNGLHRQEFPKSEAGERTLVLPDFVWPMLAERKLRSTAPMVFPNRFGRWLEAANVTQLWRQACGEEFKHVRQKDFRTAVATLIARELGSEAAAGQLGHSSDQVTKRFYIEPERKTQDNTAVFARKSI